MFCSSKMRIIVFFTLLQMCACQIMPWFHNISVIRHELMIGNLVIIEDAFSEEVLSKFDVSQCSFEDQELSDIYKKDYSFRSIDNECSANFHAYIRKAMGYFNNFHPTMTLRKLVLEATKFEKDQYLDNHNDFNGYEYQSRALTFILHLTDMPEDCNGDFLWMGNLGVQRIPVKRNQLLMFIPSEVSHHAVDDVYCEERISISGWFFS